ncbi:ParB/RepB/Spo0J family partition protein [Streptomyces specialis]|uniref:ParB/RepB/Spo0J family partition protein n=1 Tax=Streptomyces specialis TaxID=498367 RepID=UPI00073EEBB1|nr:ParB N-terminal domain-containing protein [Streptomyces specialis]
MTPTVVKTAAKKTTPRKAATRTQKPAQAPATAQPATVRFDIGRLEYLDPHALVIDPFNHRKKRRTGDATEPDAKLVASVRAAGVQVPLLVRPQADGATYGVVWGQRRLGAALVVAAEAKKDQRPYALVPCLVRDDLAEADDEALVASMTENTHRRAAGERDDIDALTQLSLMEISDTKRARHAKALGYHPAEIRCANRAAKLTDEELRSALAAEFDLLEAADYAEVRDVPGALGRLTKARADDRKAKRGRRGHWAHALQLLRQQKADEHKRAAVREALTAARVPIVAFQYHWAHSRTRPLTDLRTALGNEITPGHHAADCPGHAAALHPETIEPVYVCTAWQRHRLSQDAERNGGKPADRAEKAAERRRVIAHNKAWRAAREVRWQFITELCGRKTASDAAWALILSTVTGGGHTYARYVGRHRTDLTARFLGIRDPEHARDWQRTVIARTGRTRRWRPLLAQVAAVMESEIMHDHAWRNPGGDLRQWLAFLASEGYTLSAIEQETRPAPGKTKPAPAAGEAA